jgi:hypothetical protein
MKSAAAGERYCQHAFMVDVFTSSHVTLLTSLQSRVQLPELLQVIRNTSLRFGLYACIYFGMIRLMSWHLFGPQVAMSMCC